ncbi:hypothetical protein Taro_054756 [Colocasia esculenta]|uniref:Uncharacterized protein n=1 Tax=Colocasia esculenta TaxID=4460 RepID=A0A843XRF5_COLES|nr:hypothetical protein [Colocasia esculenta]
MAKRIGPILPNRSGSGAGRVVIRMDPPPGRESNGSDAIRSDPIRGSATIRSLICLMRPDSHIIIIYMIFIFKWGVLPYLHVISYIQGN